HASDGARATRPRTRESRLRSLSCSGLAAECGPSEYGAGPVSAMGERCGADVSATRRGPEGEQTMKCRPLKCPLVQCPLRTMHDEKMARIRSLQCNLRRWRQRHKYEATFPFRLRPQFRKDKLRGNT